MSIKHCPISRKQQLKLLELFVAEVTARSLRVTIGKVIQLRHGSIRLSALSRSM